MFTLIVRSNIRTQVNHIINNTSIRNTLKSLDHKRMENLSKLIELQWKCSIIGLNLLIKTSQTRTKFSY